MAERTAGFEAKSSYSLQLTGVSDLEIYNRAKTRNNVVIISKDSDFVNLIQNSGSPPKLINVVMGNCSSTQLWKILDKVLDEIIRTFFEEKVDIIELKEPTT